MHYSIQAINAVLAFPDTLDAQLLAELLKGCQAYLRIAASVGWLP